MPNLSADRPLLHPKSDLELLTENEHKAMDLTVELWNLLVSDVVSAGRSRTKDLHELVHHIHVIQHAVMSQAAARAYPERYRLLGGVVEERTDG